MLEIYSPTGGEADLAAYIHDTLNSHGVEAEIDRVGNVIARIGSGKPTVLLCGHMDTVPGFIPVRTRGTRVYGRGAVDAKGALAAMISASIVASTCISEGSILLACVVDEEGGSKGVLRLVEDRVEADYAVFGEPSNTRNVTVGYKGRLQVKLEAEGPGGHAGAAWMFENPVEALFRVYTAVKSKIEDPSEKDDMFYKHTVALTFIKGGEALNAIPCKAEAYLDVRVPPGSTCIETGRMIEEEASKVAQKYRRVKLRVAVQDSTDPYEENPSSKVVEAFVEAVKSELNLEPRLLRKTGTSDMNVYAAFMKTPSVSYGPGNSRLSHRRIEWIELEDYLSSIRIILRALSRLIRFDVDRALKILEAGA